MIGEAEREEGLRAYEQVQAFAALRRKKLPVIYVLFTLVLAAAGLASVMGGVMVPGTVCFGSAILFAIFAVWNWRRLGALDVRNRVLLARLHARHGDDLPWLEVERHLAELEKLKAELRKNPGQAA